MKTDSLPKTCRPSRLHIPSPPRNNPPSPSITETTQIGQGEHQQSRAAFLDRGKCPGFLGSLAPSNLPPDISVSLRNTYFIWLSYFCSFWSSAQIPSLLQCLSSSQSNVLLVNGRFWCCSEYGPYNYSNYDFQINRLFCLKKDSQGKGIWETKSIFTPNTPRHSSLME